MSDVVERDIALEAAEIRAATAEYRLHSFRQHRAGRSKALAEFIQSRAPELWPDYAALSVNGSVYSDDSTIEPTYERAFNVAVHRAEKAEEEAVSHRARWSRLCALVMTDHRGDGIPTQEVTPDEMVAAVERVFARNASLGDAVAAEREQCARVAQELADNLRGAGDIAEADGAYRAAAAIRKGG